MRKIKIKISKRVKLVMLLTTITGLIGFTEISVSEMVCEKVIVNIRNTTSNHFVTEEDIMELMSEDGIDVVGQPFNRLNLKELERRVLVNKYVESCDIYKDIKGNLYVNNVLRKPVARIVQDQGPGAYITANGEFLPLSDSYTARVMIVSGEFTKYLMSADFKGFGEQRAFLDMLNYINENDFWKAQIAQVDIDAYGKIMMVPQITKQRIEFGGADEYIEKLKKLKLFYKEVLPRKGWNAYERVNVEFDNQIIAE